MRATERQMRKLQKQRHMYDIQQMILGNPLFKNLHKRDQGKLINLVYKAEMMEMFMRDRQLVRINDSFDDIVDSVARMLDDAMGKDDDDIDGFGDDFK